MLYSSGTTGRPKGVKVPLPDAPLGTADAMYMLSAGAVRRHRGQRLPLPAPLYHAAPLRFCMAFHRVGATVVVMEHFDAAEALALIERHRVTHSQWVPTMFIRMLKLPEERAHGATTCPRCRWPSTRRRRARWRSRSR